MDVKIRKNNYGEYIILDADNFREGIAVIANNAIHQIQLRGSNNNKFDFSILLPVAELIEVLSFSGFGSICEINNLEVLYSFKKLQTLFFHEKECFSLDISRFENLISLGTFYWNGISSLFNSNSIGKLALSGFNDNTLRKMVSLRNLNELHISQSRLLSLEHIEECVSLSKLTLTYNSLLINASSINETSLKELRIEKCRNLHKASYLFNNTSIEELYLDVVDSLYFVPSMKNLKKIYFLNCKDGNLQPLLESQSLEIIYFPSNRKHYTHKLQEIKELRK